MDDPLAFSNTNSQLQSTETEDFLLNGVSLPLHRSNRLLASRVSGQECYYDSPLHFLPSHDVSDAAVVVAAAADVVVIIVEDGTNIVLKIGKFEYTTFYDGGVNQNVLVKQIF